MENIKSFDCTPNPAMNVEIANFSSGISKDQNIGKHGYIGNWILRKYRKYRKYRKNIGGYFYKNIGY